jgi:hypothetical protein
VDARNEFGTAVSDILEWSQQYDGMGQGKALRVWKTEGKNQ